MFRKLFDNTSLLQIFMYFSCIVGPSIPSTNAQVISSFFGVAKDKDFKRNILEVAPVAKESQLHCALSCMQNDECTLSSFDQGTGLCLLYRAKNSNDSVKLEDSRFRNPKFTNFWKLGEFDPRTSQFFTSPNDLKESTSAWPGSCAEVTNKINGVYKLSIGNNRFVDVYCVMENIPGCAGSGWALAMKIDGFKSTFTYDAPYWNNTQTLNYPAYMASLDGKEMKSPIFWEMKARKVCVGMKQENDTNWLQIDLNADSLHSLFASGRFFGTNLGKSSWKNLLKGASLLDTCIKEGANLVTGKPSSVIKTRLGIIGSDRPCNDNIPKSFIGFGSSIVTSSGNVVLSGQLVAKTFGYVLIQ